MFLCVNAPLSSPSLAPSQGRGLLIIPPRAAASLNISLNSIVNI